MRDRPNGMAGPGIAGALALGALLGSGPVVPTAKAWQPEILNEPTGEVYLPDFSFAGYRWGESDPPRPVATHDVTEFGAIADDGIDDTAAILDALRAAGQGAGPAVLAFPKGRFVLKAILPIEKSHFVLKGAGSGTDGTILEIPIALKDLQRPEELDELQTYLVDGDKREKRTGYFYSPYSWMGGFIWPRVPGKRIFPYLEAYDQPSQALATAASGTRGGHVIGVDSAERLEVGEQVRLEWYNLDGRDSSLLRHLYMLDEIKAGSRHWETPERPLIFQDVTITAIEGTQITVKEPLRHDLRPEWRSVLTRTDLLEEVGVEGLRIEFPETLRARHHLEPGYNAIYLTGVTQSWVRDVAIMNADGAILSDDASQTTIEDVRVTGRPMHYGIHLGRVSGMLVRRLAIDAEAYHTLSFNTYASGSVFSDVQITADARLDQHRGSNHQNLFDHIRIRMESDEPQTFKHGGASYWKPTHGAYNTFWNIEIAFAESLPAQAVVDLGGEDEGPHARLVGVHANRPITLSYGPDAHVEGLGQPGIDVPSLHAWQLGRRLD